RPRPCPHQVEHPVRGAHPLRRIWAGRRERRRPRGAPRRAGPLQHPEHDRPRARGPTERLVRVNERVSPTGVLVVRKPRGPTSHDIVAQARRLFRTREVGHAGTLDPMASGVLVLLLGEATKLAGYLTLEEKEYRATVAFGRSTDTLDAEGET